MALMHARTHRSLRLLFAGLMLLATLAAARLQGEAAARLTAGAGLGLTLCSGNAVPADEAPGQSGAVSHCIVCFMPVGLAAAEPVGMVLRVARRLIISDPAPAAAETATISAYLSRGPPLAG